ncbi:IucA/IucC family protein [Actinocatenispora sera]|uniref:IucA/IucC family protein n=1 Tax=Actinocatenispora sera TaxID=390989 RepID=UPI0033F570C2
MTTLETPATRPNAAPSAGERAAIEALLRCYVLDNAVPVPERGPLRLRLPGGGAVTVDVRYRSATGLHGFGPVSTVDGAVGSAAALAALLTGDDPDLVARVADSAGRIDRYLRARAAEAAADGGSAQPPIAEPGAVSAPPAATRWATMRRADGFLAAEQDLLLGHLLHPAAKSRDGIDPDEDARYAPELRGRFPLHWFAVDPDLVRTGSVPHPALSAPLPELLGAPTVDARPILPAHPWQAADLLHRTGFRQLIDDGRIEPLGPAGPDWYPTSSLRTVYRPGHPVMLKLSLGLRITNSRRENTPTELVRGLEVQRLLAAGIAAPVAAAYPKFRILADPAYASVQHPDGTPTQLDVSVREAPPGLTAARVLAGLVAPQPGVRDTTVVRLVRGLAAGRSTATVAAEWVRRYVDRVLAPMVLLYATTGIGLEAHQQNTLVLLDGDGWPDTGWYRDNQGYYLATSALPAVLAATGATESTLAVTEDSIVDDRLTYYLLFNQALAPVSALGAAGVADERDLLGALRDGLRAIVARGHDTSSGLVRRWLTADRLPRKANLATRLAGIDEVLAPVDRQSIYLTVPNPVREAR